MPDIRMPDGAMVRFPDDMPEAAIRGLIAQKFPREVGEMGAAVPRGQRDTTGHPEYRRETQGPDDALGAYALGGVDGVPIAGPALSAATRAAASVLPSITSGQPFGEVYEEMGRRQNTVEREHPVASTAGRVTGAVMGTLPLLRAAPAAFGLGTAALPARMFASGLSGSGLNAADAGVRSGGDAQAMADGAKSGMVVGVAGPLIGPLVGKGVKAVADKVQFAKVAKALGLDRQALGLVKDAATKDALTPETARKLLSDLGPDAMLMDIGPNLRSVGAGLAAMPGEGNTVVRSALAARDKGANQRIIEALDTNLGPAPVPSRVVAGIEGNQALLSPRYREALEDALPVDTSRIAQYLDREIQTLRGDAQRGVQRVRSMLNRTGTEELENSPAVLLQTRQAVDDMLETAQGRNHINALSTARQAIDDQLRASVPGIKEVDAPYAELARQKEALQRGQQVLSSGREAPRPVELSEQVERGALPQGMQVGPSAVPVRLRQGARAEIERIVGTNANDRVALQRLIKGEGDWNRDRLATLFGKDKADAVIKLLDRERQFYETADRVVRNSETAARQSAKQAIEGAGGTGLGSVDGFVAGGVGGAARGAAVQGVNKVFGALKSVKSDQVRGQIGTMLTGRSPVLETLLSGGVNVPVSQIDRVARALLLSAPKGR